MPKASAQSLQRPEGSPSRGHPSSEVVGRPPILRTSEGLAMGTMYSANNLSALVRGHEPRP